MSIELSSLHAMGHSRRLVDGAAGSAVARQIAALQRAVADDRIAREATRIHTSVAQALQASASQLLARQAEAFRQSFATELKQHFRSMAAQQALNQQLALEKTTREAMRATMSVSALASRSWATYVREHLASTQAQAVFAAQMQVSLERMYPAFAGTFARTLGDALADTAGDELASPTDESATVEDVLTRTVSDLAKDGTRVDWKFVINLILTVLLFLAALDAADHTAAITDEQLRAIEQQVMANAAALEVFNTRSVLRATPLHIGPGANARALGKVPQDASVIVMEVRGKWVRVQIVVHDANGRRSATAVGWMLKKYLARAL